MFPSTNPFGQPSQSPFGSQSGFGQTNSSSNPFAPKPFGSTTPFGSPIGSSIFGGSSNGVAQPSSPFTSNTAFGASSSPAFSSSVPPFWSSSTPAFGSSSSSYDGSSVFGQKPAFGCFGATQPSQPAFGSSIFGSSTPFGASSQHAFGTSNNPIFGSSCTSAFGTSSTPFGASSTPAFGTSSTPSFSFGFTQAFGSSSPFGSTASLLARQSSAFGFQTPTSTFGNTGIGQSGFGGQQHGGSRVASYTATTEADSGTSGPKLESISAMPNYKDKSHEELRWEDYQLGDKGATSTPALGSTSSTTFDSTGSAYGVSSSPVFGGGGSFGASSNPIFGSSSTSAFGTSSTPFGTSSTPAFAVSSTPSFSFGFTQIGQPSSAYGSSSPFGSSASPLRSQYSKFGATSTPAFGSTISPTFGSTGSAFGVPISLVFGHGGGFGAPSNPIFGSSSTSAFGTSSTPFGASSTPAFGASSTASFSFGSTQASSAFGSSNPFGSTASPFGDQNSEFGLQTRTSTFGNTGIGQSGFGGQQGGGSRVASYTATAEADSGTSGPKLESISAMPILEDKTHEELRWEDYQLGDKGGPLPSTQLIGLTGFSPSTSPVFGQSSANPFFTTTPNSNPFVSKSSPFSSGFGTSAAPAFSSPAFGSSTSAAAAPSIFCSIPSPSGANSSSTPSFGQSSSLFNAAPAQGTSSPFCTSIFGITQSSPLFSSTAPTIAQTGSAFGQNTSPFGQTTPFSQSSLFNSPSSSLVSIFSSIAASLALQANLVRIILDSRNISNEARVTPPDRTSSQDKDKEKSAVENDPVKEQAQPITTKQTSNGSNEDHSPQKADSGHRAGEDAAIVYEYEADVEALMPKLRWSDYYTLPRIHELAAKERAEPGFCSHVKDFVVGRQGYGSIRFLGETDVRGLDLESLIQFNTREVIVYKDDSKKPPVGQGLNKPAEITLLNIKCFNKKTGHQYTEGPKIEKYKGMLKRIAEDQGAEFVSYDPIKGEWKIRVKHFSVYKLVDDHK